MSADVYSLTIILFELFSGIDPFPGHIGQIFQKLLSDKRPAIPKDFPCHLKGVVLLGWSKEPKMRPQLAEFKAVLIKMLKLEKSHEILLIPTADKPLQSVEAGYYQIRFIILTYTIVFFFF